MVEYDTLALESRCCEFFLKTLGREAQPSEIGGLSACDKVGMCSILARASLIGQGHHAQREQGRDHPRQAQAKNYTHRQESRLREIY